MGVGRPKGQESSLGGFMSDLITAGTKALECLVEARPFSAVKESW